MISIEPVGLAEFSKSLTVGVEVVASSVGEVSGGLATGGGVLAASVAGDGISFLRSGIGIDGTATSCSRRAGTIAEPRGISIRRWGGTIGIFEVALGVICGSRTGEFSARRIGALLVRFAGGVDAAGFCCSIADFLPGPL